MLGLGLLGVGFREILILTGLVVLFFGSKKIPELARGIGEAIGYIKDGFSDEYKNDETDEKNKIE